jgi:hypothetical protein
MENVSNNKSALTPAETEEITKYGIERVATETYTYRNYRYTNLSDAIAHAKLELERKS